jgi:hypothetical protein
MGDQRSSSGLLTLADLDIYQEFCCVDGCLTQGSSGWKAQWRRAHARVQGNIPRAYRMGCGLRRTAVVRFGPVRALRTGPVGC